MNGSAPVILLGAQRSGTTALAAVLDAGYDDAGGTFTINGRLPYLLHRWCTDGDLAARHLRVDELLHALHRKPPYGRNAQRWLETTERVLRAAGAEVADGAYAPGGPYAPGGAPAVTLRRRLVRECYAGSSRYGDKYNEYLLELDSLAETIPDAHWVLLVRHPNDVARSTLNWSGDRPWLPGTRQAALHKWAAWHEPLLRHPVAADPRRCIVLEYGRLCAGEDLRRLSTAIDLDLTAHADLLSHRPGDDTAPELPARVAEIWTTLLARRQMTARG